MITERHYVIHNFSSPILHESWTGMLLHLCCRRHTSFKADDSTVVTLVEMTKEIGVCTVISSFFWH